jgi:anti-repressor protein
MNELIKVNYNADRITLSARELYEFLEVKTKFTMWFERMAEYGFTENIDYRVRFPFLGSKNRGGQNKEDYEITLDMAKEIAMLQRSEKGKQCRQYFIEVEKKWNDPMFLVQRSMAYLNERCNALLADNKVLLEENAEMKPKASYYDKVLNCKDLVSITTIAKDYNWTAQKMNKYLHDKGVQYKQGKRWFLYKKYADEKNGYTGSKTPLTTGKDGKEHAHIHTYWTQKGRLFIYDLLKNDGILPTIEKGEQ